MQNVSDNNRIAKNTIMLYFRMLLTLLVGLYTARVVLKTLGASDYGLYNVVGGIVTLFMFVNVTLSTGTLRFLTFALGQGDTRCREKKIVVSKEISNEDFVRHPALSAGGPWNKLFLLDIIKKKHIRFPVDITTMEDNIFVWSYLLHCTYISISNKNYYDYNRRNGSLVRSVHRMEEIYRLCLAIVPIYNQLLIKFSLSQQIIRDYDRYLFVSCLKRLLISNCNGLPFKKVKQIIEKVLYEMETIVKRMSMQSNLTKVEKMMLEMMLHHCICIIALFSKLNSMMFNK